jgi:hypothetical protein
VTKGRGACRPPLRIPGCFCMKVGGGKTGDGPVKIILAIFF